MCRSFIINSKTCPLLALTQYSVLYTIPNVCHTRFNIKHESGSITALFQSWYFMYIFNVMSIASICQPDDQLFCSSHLFQTVRGATGKHYNAHTLEPTVLWYSVGANSVGTSIMPAESLWKFNNIAGNLISIEEIWDKYMDTIITLIVIITTCNSNDKLRQW